MKNKKNEKETEKKKVNESKNNKESDEKGKEKGDLAVVRFNHIGTDSDELTLYKGEYLIVTDWDIGDDYAFGYKRNEPNKKGKFPSPLVSKCFENKGLLVFFINYIYYI